MERLEHEAVVIAPEERERIVVHRGELALAEENLPGVHRLEPAMTFRSVDLPMPDSPRIAMYSPARTSSEIWCRTVRPPKRLPTAESLSTLESYYVHRASRPVVEEQRAQARELRKRLEREPLELVRVAWGDPHGASRAKALSLPVFLDALENGYNINVATTTLDSAAVACSSRSPAAAAWDSTR